MFSLRTNRICLVVLGLLMAVLHASAQDIKWTRRFYFELDKYAIRYDLRGNRAMMDSTVIMLKQLLNSPDVYNVRLDITSSSSLEASDAYNTRLSGRRNAAFVSELRAHMDIPFEVLFVHDNVFDWEQLYELTAASQCPMRQQALDIIRHTPGVVDNKQTDNRRKLKLMELAEGETYRYMEKYLFSEMRNTSVTISAQRKPVAEPAPAQTDTIILMQTDTVVVDNFVYPPALDGPRYVIGVKTNMLYDLSMTPNIGLELYLAPHISLGANWAYAWWNRDKSSFYWRAYGGDAELRYWFKPWYARENSLRDAFSGHHLGLYGLMCTYDYEFGGNGQQAPKWSYGGGISYGYSLPVTKCLNIDFTIGLGYLQGKYYRYEPSSTVIDDYYWLSTHTRKYWGPTKAEVSLVWKLGL